MNIYLENHTNPIALQGYMSKVKITGPDYRIFHHREIGQNVCYHDNSWTAALRLMVFCMNMYLGNL